jgi:hypothetical protein
MDQFSPFYGKNIFVSKTSSDKLKLIYNIYNNYVKAQTTVPSRFGNLLWELVLGNSVWGTRFGELTLGTRFRSSLWELASGNLLWELASGSMQ